MRSIGTIGLGLALAGLALGCGNAPEATGGAPPEESGDASPPETKQLDVEEVAARLSAGEDLFLLDVRTAEELEQDGALAGYAHIPIDELEGRLAEVPKDKPIVAY